MRTKAIAVVATAITAVLLCLAAPVLLLGTGATPAAGGCSPGHLGWTRPVDAPVGSGYRTASRPRHNGVDLIAARGTTICAAAAGTVVRVRCNVNPAGWGCDRDGSPTLVAGCGFYVDIAHPGDLYTRYCHMLHAPAVTVGQAVVAGQPIGIVGSTGHSSGPHLHFEVHKGGTAWDTGIDPVAFMRTVAAALGDTDTPPPAPGEQAAAAPLLAGRRTARRRTHRRARPSETRNEPALPAGSLKACS
jgi:murein DD-endopeptidase MepM/ murein hydrolase activator NlpD